MMNTEQDFTKFFGQLPAGFQFDKNAATDALQTWATFGERLSGITLEAAARSNEIATTSTKETLARLGDVTKVRDEPSEYAQAAADYVQGHFELSRRTAEAFASVVQKAQTDTVELVGTAGERATQQVAAGAGSKKTTKAAKPKQVAKTAK